MLCAAALKWVHHVVSALGPIATWRMGAILLRASCESRATGAWVMAARVAGGRLGRRPDLLESGAQAGTGRRLGGRQLEGRPGRRRGGQRRLALPLARLSGGSAAAPTGGRLSHDQPSFSFSPAAEAAAPMRSPRPGSSAPAAGAEAAGPGASPALPRRPPPQLVGPVGRRLSASCAA